MLIPCVKAEKFCSPCAGDSSNPLANLSIEPFDLNIWLSVAFTSVVNPVPNSWSTVACVGFCESSISQADAYDCARRRALECLPDPPDPPRPPPPDPQPPPFQNRTFCNDAVSCQSGSDCYTVPACTVLGNTVAEANALAQSICNSRVLDYGLSSPCGPVVPPAPPLPPLDCPSEVGAAISSLELSSEQLWETHSLDDSTVVDYDLVPGACFSTGLGLYVPVLPIDHPPGNYGLRYIDGLVHQNNPAFCSNPAFPYDAGAFVYTLQNEEHNYDTPDPCNVEYLANTLFPSGGSGKLGCFASAANAVAEINSHFLGKTFRSDPYPPDSFHAFPHLNTGGNFSIMQLGFGPEQDYDRSFPFGPIRFQVVQLEGLIPQPRKVAIADYAALISQFADPVGAAGWNGEFNLRSTYTSAVLDWQVAAGGAFGGAKLSYITTHPTSSNGRGWQLDIYSAGMIPMWRGFRGVGADPIGYFYKHSPSTAIGPDCIQCVDNSDIPWEPS